MQLSVGDSEDRLLLVDLRGCGPGETGRKGVW